MATGVIREQKHQENERRRHWYRRSSPSIGGVFGKSQLYSVLFPCHLCKARCHLQIYLDWILYDEKHSLEIVPQPMPKQERNATRKSVKGERMREDKNVSPGNCPWCLAKGQTHALRYYAVNFEETIMLCTNPVCLYPLVSRPLEDVRASLSITPEGCKRKSSILSEVDDVSPLKRSRDENPEEMSAVPEPCDLNGSTLPNHTSNTEILTEENVILETTTENEIPEELPVDVDEKDDGVYSTQDEIEEMIDLDVAVETPVELVPSQPHLFWKNEDNLCWLDSLLVMLVNCRTMREALSQDVNQPKSVVRNLCSTYNKTCAYVKSKEEQCEDKITRVPSDVLEVAEQKLSAVRLSLFKLLQPTLKCEFGKEETPVFAFPLLLRSDKWAEDLFQHTVRWEFKCTSCGYTNDKSSEKTLTSLTQIMSDWHPLKATHRTQCNNCNRKNQRRRMVLERLSSVFALHFVEGLPRKDISKYSFEFEGTHYNVSTVIQYNKELKHFVTWIHQSNGSWLELDDLRYPNSFTHKRFTLRAKEIHVVFWEAESPIANVDDEHLSDSATNDSCVLNAMTVNEDADVTTASTLNASIGSNTLLETFEGLSHTDIVTLTLVEETAVTKATHLPVPQSSAIVPAVVPNLPVASSLSSHCPPSSPQSHQTHSSTSSEVTLPSAVRSTVVTETHSPKLPAAIARNPVGLQHASLLQLHLSNQSTPVRPSAPKARPVLRCENSEAHPAKPADTFGGFLTKKSSTLPDPSGNNPSTVPQQKLIGLQPGACHGGKASEILKLAGKKTPSLSVVSQPINDTNCLRLKLMKKLKAKKKKLAKLNQLLVNGGEAAPKPDSTALSSPYSVTSSTSAYDSPAYDQFLADLLSPATTVSNLSPDSTGLQEVLNTQNSETMNGSLQPAATIPTVVPEQTFDHSSTDGSFMNIDDFIQSDMGQTAIENTDFNALDLFF